VDAVGRVLGGPVAHARLLDIERTGAGEDGASRKVAVADEAMAAGVIAERIELVDDLGNLQLEGALEELAGALAGRARRAARLDGRRWSAYLRTWGVPSPFGV
jgi:hypothetical protein